MSQIEKAEIAARAILAFMEEDDVNAIEFMARDVVEGFNDETACEDLLDRLGMLDE